jgi:mannose-6-phosphate isomerase-like protein (cupin superfamily)
MASPVRGRLLPPAGAPDTGERTHELARVGGAVVEQILSGRLDAPADYLQDTDEWVVVLAGSASLEVDGEMLELTAGDWVLLPAGTPHRRVETAAGTSWLTVTGTT